MSKDFVIVNKGLEEKCITRYLETNNISLVSRELDVSHEAVKAYLDWVKETHPEWIDRYSENARIDVFRILNRQVRKLDGKINKWETEGKDTQWLSGLRELRGFLSSYVDTLSKLWDIRRQEEERQVILEAIKEASPEVQLKIISKLKELKEMKGLIC